MYGHAAIFQKRGASKRVQTKVAGQVQSQGTGMFLI
jgi:hypothetical protein